MVIGHCDEVLAVPRYRVLFRAYVCPLLIPAKASWLGMVPLFTPR